MRTRSQEGETASDNENLAVNASDNSALVTKASMMEAAMMAPRALSHLGRAGQGIGRARYFSVSARTPKKTCRYLQPLHD